MVSERSPGAAAANKGVTYPDQQAREAISSRLSKIQDIRLPASLLRDQPRPGAAAVQEHLQDLLARDAAVFLERYASLLTHEELSSFEPLRNNFEVDFYLQRAEAAQQQQAVEQDKLLHGQRSASGRAQLSSTAKNRRLAFMRRLEQEGEYFSEHAMRERQPLIWQECIGRHEGHPVLPAPAGGRGFASSLLASYDEAMLRARLEQELEDEEAAMSEHDSDSDMPDTTHDHQLQQQQEQEEQKADEEEGSASTQGQAGATRLAVPHASKPPTSITTPAAASSARTDAARAAGAAAAGTIAQQQQQQQQQAAAMHAAAGVDMCPEAMARRRQDFLLEMQHRFLEGLDDGDHSYEAIDGDMTLDDDWAREQAQDAEDAYFDS